jgi:uncharacterized caspase-like protein
MGKLTFLCLITIIICYPVLALEHQADKYALVIGNQRYAEAPLKHAENDALEMADALTSLDFKVTTLIDVDSQTVSQEVKHFYQQIHDSEAPSKLVLFYYAGHAIQIQQSNYLIPVGLTFATQDEFLAKLYNLSDLFSQIASAANVQQVVILDACRNNPFGQGFTTPGLAAVKAPTGTIIAFATEPGGVASDGRQGNGIYTKHLLRHISKSITVEALFKHVRKGVARETRSKQIPWEHSSLIHQVYLNPPKNLDVPDIVIF